ncbi:MAG: hypothetical protein JW781_05995 [Deltaproteobacteria bacterium]|nr:hypothetical protein [Candidatus Anaeroferrophillacea bacterium]
MDSRFLEFWGHMLLQAARNQQLLEFFSSGSDAAKDNVFAGWMQDPSRWPEYCRTNLPGWPGFDDLFRDFFRPAGSPGRDGAGKGSGNDSAPSEWAAGFDAWQRQWREFARLFGFVPGDEFDRLGRELGEVRERLRDAEATIERLRRNSVRGRTDDSGADLFDLNRAAAAFDHLLQEQNRRFAEFLGAAGKNGVTVSADVPESAGPEPGTAKTRSGRSKT